MKYIDITIISLILTFSFCFPAYAHDPGLALFIVGGLSSIAVAVGYYLTYKVVFKSIGGKKDKKQNKLLGCLTWIVLTIILAILLISFLANPLYFNLGG